MSLEPDYCERCEAIDEPTNNIIIGDVDGEDVCHICRRQELEEETFLSEQEALTVSLKQFGWTHQEIADEFSPSKSTIDEYSRRANAKRDKAQRTVDKLS